MALLKKFDHLCRKILFKGSGDYWERRYRSGRNSGSGSYGKFAAFKADFLNRFVRENGVGSIVEFGCGDGNQLSLAEYSGYLGLDVAPTAIARCRERFEGDATKRFAFYDPAQFDADLRRYSADAAFSLDVIFHLVEDQVYEIYMRHLFAAGQRFVVILSSNTDEQSMPSVHVRHRRFTDHVSRKFPAWRLVATHKNPNPENFADFFVYRKG